MRAARTCRFEQPHCVDSLSSAGHLAIRHAAACYHTLKLATCSAASKMMQSVSRRLTAILTHISPPSPSSTATFTAAARHRLQSFHTRIARSRLSSLTDASLAISRLPTALPLPTANIPASPTSSTYASVWSSILASSSSSFSSTSGSPIKPILPPQSAADAGKLTVVLDMDECLLHSHIRRHTAIHHPTGRSHSPHHHPSLSSRRTATPPPAILTT